MIQNSTAEQTGFAQKEYTALTQGAALQIRQEYGVVRVFEADHVDFIQRMTTNDVARLGPNQATVTVLTNPIARTQFAFTVMQRGQDFLLLSAGTDGTALARHLHSQIFFGDKVQAGDLSANVRRMRLMGPKAAATLAQSGLPTPPPEHFDRTGNVTVLHQSNFDVPGYEILVPVPEAEQLAARLVQAGAVLLADDAGYNVRRVELGRPGFGTEITDDFTPLESGLAWTCAENKGCYTGQEIIARQITYDKVTKTLVGVRSDTPMPPGTDLHAAEAGRAVGTVTSSVISPQFGPIALAVVRRPYNEAGTELKTSDGLVNVTSLPFEKK